MEFPDNDFAIYPGVSQYTGRHWLKWGMRWLYGVDYIHAWIAFVGTDFDGNQVPMVYHSTGRGVHTIPWEEFQNERIVKAMWEVPLDPDVFAALVRETETEAGKKYSSRQLYGMVVAKILGLKKLPFGANRNDAHVCSETAGRMLVKYTPVGFGEKDPDLYTPKDFHETCRLLETMGKATRLMGTHHATT